MKIFKFFITASSIGLLMLSSCKKDGKLVTSNGGKPGTLTASVTTTLNLDKAKLTDTSSIIRFQFTPPDFGFSAAVTNTLQIDLPGDNWKNPTSATLNTKVYSQGYSTAAFNALLLKLGVPAGVQTAVQIRVMHSISSGVAPVYSNTLNLNVKAFNLAAWLYVVGQFNGYSASAPDSIYSATSNGIFTGIIHFTAGNNRFLVLPAKNYDNKYATTASPNTANASLTYTTEYVTGGGSDLYAPAADGWYLITLNTNTQSITVAPVNFYSVIGTVTPGGDFSTDVDLKFVNSTDQDWEGVLAFTYGSFPGSFKVREDHDWTNSWGTPATPDGVNLTSSSGGNIPVATSGNYKFTFSIATTAYSKGTGSTLPATYTLIKQ